VELDEEKEEEEQAVVSCHLLRFSLKEAVKAERSEEERSQVKCS